MRDVERNRISDVSGCNDQGSDCGRRTLEGSDNVKNLVYAVHLTMTHSATISIFHVTLSAFAASYK